jgi:hypothetical protein
MLMFKCWLQESVDKNQSLLWGSASFYAGPRQQWLLVRFQPCQDFMFDPRWSASILHRLPFLLFCLSAFLPVSRLFLAVSVYPIFPWGRSCLEARDVDRGSENCFLLWDRCHLFWPHSNLHQQVEFLRDQVLLLSKACSFQSVLSAFCRMSVSDLCSVGEDSVLPQYSYWSFDILLVQLLLLRSHRTQCVKSGSTQFTPFHNVPPRLVRWTSWGMVGSSYVPDIGAAVLISLIFCDFMLFMSILNN